MKKLFLIFFTALIAIAAFSENIAFLSTIDGKIIDGYAINYDELMGEYYNNIYNMLSQNQDSSDYDVYFNSVTNEYYTLEGLVDFLVIEKYISDSGKTLDKNALSEQALVEVQKYKANQNSWNSILSIFEKEEYFTEFMKGLVIKQTAVQLVREDFETYDKDDFKSYLEANFNDIKNQYSQVQASHILVSTEASAVEIKKEIENGDISFEEAAKKYSIDSGSGKNGGDLDWFTKSQMVEEFGNAAFDAEVGIITEPVKSQYGYHLILVKDKKIYNTIEDIIDDSEVYNEVENNFKSYNLSKWFENYRKNYSFVIDSESLKLEQKIINSANIFNKLDLEKEYSEKINEESSEDFMIAYAGLADYAINFYNESVNDLKRYQEIKNNYGEYVSMDPDELENEINGISQDATGEEADKDSALKDLYYFKQVYSPDELENPENYLSDYQVNLNRVNDKRKEVLTKLYDLSGESLNVLIKLYNYYSDDPNVLFLYSSAYYNYLKSSLVSKDIGNNAVAEIKVLKDTFKQLSETEGLNPEYKQKALNIVNEISQIIRED